MEPTIRLYRNSDAPGVIGLSLRAWAPVFASVRDVLGEKIFRQLYGDDWQRRQQSEVEKVLADEKTKVWIAEADDQVIGFVAAFLRADENMGEIRMLAVEPDHQNRGLGSELTEVGTDWIRNSGMPLAVISTGGDIGHAPARRTYEKVGFSPFPSMLYFRVL
jgi:GNAT superfamily N-acetyltransferase